MTFNKTATMKLIKSWCSLDNWYGDLNSKLQMELMNRGFTLKKNPEMQKLSEEMERVDKVRHLIMQAFEYEDYDAFVEYLLFDLKISFNKVLDRWEI